MTGPGGSYIYVTSPTPRWLTLQGGTTRATGDQAPALALRMATRYGLAEVMGSRRVLGRDCTVVRTGGPFGSPLTRPTVSNYADLCLDRGTGVILDEVWVIDGKLGRERRAVRLDTSPRFSASDFAPATRGPLVPAGSPGQTVVVPDSAADAASLPVWLDPPPGYHLDGMESEITLESSDSLGATGPESFVYAHFVSGPDLIDLEQGDVGASPGSIRVRLAHGRTGELSLDMTASYLDVTMPGGQVAQLQGPDPGLLISAAAGLFERPRPAPG